MEEVEQEHLRIFSIPPIFIGLFWSEKQEDQMDRILESMAKGIPFDEYNYLTDDEKKQYDEGVLDF